METVAKGGGGALTEPGFPSPAGEGTTALTKGRYTLADLLAGMTPEAMAAAFDWGGDRGREHVR